MFEYKIKLKCLFLQEMNIISKAVREMKETLERKNCTNE
jgi:hypothetical protein